MSWYVPSTTDGDSTQANFRRKVALCGITRRVPLGQWFEENDIAPAPLLAAQPLARPDGAEAR